MNKRQPLSEEQLRGAVEVIEEFMETEGLELWITTIRGDDYKPVRWVSKDILRKTYEEEQ